MPLWQDYCRVSVSLWQNDMVMNLRTSMLVIGGASLDVLHFAGQTASSAGGAGMYTAAAAHRLGASATMFAPCPSPVPAPLQPVVERIQWIGPVVAPEELPRFEIEHQPGGATRLLNAFWGAEARLSPDDLPDNLSRYGLIHIAAIKTARRQLDFLRACRQRGATRISAGTYGRVVEDERENVRELFEQADIFFMNESVARGLFGSIGAAKTRPGGLLFVTLGDRGAGVVQGAFGSHVSAPQVDVLDPTGAGDTFCGATLAGLARGDHPVMAARAAVALAAQMITQIGPAALWQDGPPPEEPRDPRVVLDEDRIAQVARLVATLPQVQPFDFLGDEFPPAGHPAALDYFFSATLQQFGFWETLAGKYHRPLLAPLDGVLRKGSDYLWRAWLRLLADDPEFCAPDRQAGLTREALSEIFRSDDGTTPMPALDLHLDQARSYGQDMQALAPLAPLGAGLGAGLALSPHDIVARANGSAAPLRFFLQCLDHIGGYKEDPLRKKSALLALILSQRPERFLRPAAGEALPPIIDYHLMRSCLRIGLVEVLDPDLGRALIERRLVQPGDEWAVRSAAHEAVRRVVSASGKSMGAVDWFFFNARRRCPEMSEPECFRCPVDPVCAHRKELFQPVLRTTYY